jgi:hypothetical protein
VVCDAFSAVRAETARAAPPPRHRFRYLLLSVAVSVRGAICRCQHAFHICSRLPYTPVYTTALPPAMPATGCTAPCRAYISSHERGCALPACLRSSPWFLSFLVTDCRTQRMRLGCLPPDSVTVWANVILSIHLRPSPRTTIPHLPRYRCAPRFTFTGIPGSRYRCWLGGTRFLRTTWHYTRHYHRAAALRAGCRRSTPVLLALPERCGSSDSPLPVLTVGLHCRSAPFTRTAADWFAYTTSGGTSAQTGCAPLRVRLAVLLRATSGGSRHYTAGYAGACSHYACFCSPLHLPLHTAPPHPVTSFTSPTCPSTLQYLPYP